MGEDWRIRLRQLGVRRGARDLNLRRAKRAAASAQSSQVDERSDESLAAISLDKLIPGGREIETPAGSCFLVDHVYPFSYQHGDQTLGELFSLTPRSANDYWRDKRLSELAFRDLLFIDTETTGLSGAGTLAFMVGAGFVEQGPAGDVFVVRQLFLRDHGDEGAMLLALENLWQSRAGLVSFNGRTFDIPLLETRYLMNRMPGGLDDLPHLDLLTPSRRLWRSRLGSVALSNLEARLLAVPRTEEDVPGWLIPNIYHDYVRSGNAREIGRVFYHNRLDILSMVVLARRVMGLLTESDETAQPVDLTSLGRWQASLQLTDRAEVNLRRALDADLPLTTYHLTLRNLGQLLKRGGRRHEAVLVWQQWAATSLESVEAHLELAKHFEWHEQDLDAARIWTERAMDLASRQSTPRTAALMVELLHRLNRLKRKSKATE